MKPKTTALEKLRHAKHTAQEDGTREFAYYFGRGFAFRAIGTHTKRCLRRSALLEAAMPAD